MKLKNPLISIIMPVYNSEKYIAEAIDSVIIQDNRYYELILVNDGSTDKSGMVCEEYAKRYENIIYINKKNGGLCSARNAGLDIAKGLYILFIDNDDQFVSDAIEIVVNAIHNSNADIIRFNRKRIQYFNNGKVKSDIYGCKGVCLDNKGVYMPKDTFFKEYNIVRKSGCFSGIWNGCFRKKLFQNIRFDTSIRAGGEDWIINIQLYAIAQSIYFIPDVLYIYYRRESHSISTTYQENRINAVIKSANEEKLLLKKVGVSSELYFKYAIFYLSQVIKIMMHKQSNLNMKEKKHKIDKLQVEYGFSFTQNEICKSELSIFEKLYLSLYIKRRYTILISLSQFILKVRGNT